MKAAQAPTSRTARKSNLSGNAQFVHALRRRGLRPTRTRCAILSLLAESKTHPSTESILEELNRRGERAPVATVYQNLSALTAHGLVLRFMDSRGTARFDGNVEPHCHLVCTRCGKVADAELDFAVGDPVPCPVEGDSGAPWRIEPGSMHFLGVCPDCQE